MSVHTSLKIVILLLCCGVASAQVDTNLQLLNNTYAELFDRLLDGVGYLDSSIVIIAGSDLQSQIAEKQLLTNLQKRGVELISEASAAPDSLAYIKIDLVNQSISYDKLENKQLQRTCRVELYVKIVSKHQKILLSKLAEQELQDTIQKSDIKRIENPELNFTVGKRSRSLWSKLVEPVAVSLVSGTIIYLFYSFRSR